MASQPTGEEVLKQSAILGFLIVEGVGVRSRQTVFQSTTSFVTLRVSRQSLGVLSQSAPTKLRSHVLHYLHFSDRESRTMPTEGRLPSTAYTTDLTPPHVGRALERRPVTVDLEEHRNGSPGEPRVRQPRSNHTQGRSHQSSTYHPAPRAGEFGTSCQGALMDIVLRSDGDLGWILDVG